jgi:hypothetical protein
MRRLAIVGKSIQISRLVGENRCATIRVVRVCCGLAFLVLCLAPAQARAQDALGESRRLYNSADYDGAERAVRAALQQPSQANAARVILGRVQLERFRQSANPQHLAEARIALREVDPALLDERERLELTIGFGEALFLDDRFAAAAEMLLPVLDRASALGGAAHERVLDWWATAVDRYAQGRPAAERPAHYVRIADRMRDELARDPGLGAASYWQVAAARASGDLDRAWAAAMAAWVRAGLARDRGAALRGDLERLMLQGIIPERAIRISPRDPSGTITGLTNEWEAFKASWSR